MAARRRPVAAAMLVALIASGCDMGAHGIGPTSLDSLKAGQWGGQHIAMTVAASRTDIEFDCARASVEGAIEIDRDGVFAATGTFFQERPGPTTVDGPPPRPMRLSGTVKGDDMQVKVVLTDRDEDAGTFTLTFGGSARITRCR